jgi:hypothetical protein
MGPFCLIYDHNHCTGAFVGLKTDVAYYAHITTQAEPTYVCNPENLRNQIGWAFSTLKTHYNRDRLRVTVSPLLL